MSFPSFGLLSRLVDLLLPNVAFAIALTIASETHGRGYALGNFADNRVMDSVPARTSTHCSQDVRC